MSVILGMLSVVFGSYIVEPQWFDNGPYEFDIQYQTLQECQTDSHGSGDICVGEKPSNRYTISNTTEVEAVTAKLDYTKCDYWAGCYFGDTNTPIMTGPSADTVMSPHWSK